MEKAKPIKTFPSNQQRTKPKLVGFKQKANQKTTVSTKVKQYNGLAYKLISQSAVISQQSTLSISEESDSVIEIDPLCVNGIINNLAQFDDEMKKKYSYSSGISFQVQDYVVVFAGRHQVNFKNGLPVSLYIPPAFKSTRDPVSRKIEVFIQRKLKNQIKDPMQYPYIVIDPNNSIYPTYICSWIECKRKITLQHYIEYEQQTNQYFIFGNAIHRYLQWLIRKQVQPELPTEKEMTKLYESFLYQMYLIDVQFDVFVERVENGILNLVNWYREHAIKGKIIELNKWEKKYLKINRTLGSQVMIKSKYFGIRGKVDGLFQGLFIDQKANVQYNVVIPFQLKTGLKVLDSHKKQVQFYNFLLRQQKNMPSIGLLYYSDSNLLQYRVQNPLICFQNINCHRNRIIINQINLYSQSQKVILPALPTTFDQCRLCDVSLQCSINRLQAQQIKDIEDICDQGPQKYNAELRQSLKKLSIMQVQYLKNWTQLLHEQQCFQKNSNEQNRNKNYYNKIKMVVKQLAKFTKNIKGQSIRISLFKQIQSQQMSEQIEGYFKVGQKLRIFIPMIRLSDSCRISNTWKTTKRFQIQVQIKNQDIKFNKSKCNILVFSGQIQHVEVDLQKYENSFYNYTRGYCYKFVVNADKWLKDIVINQTYEPKSYKKILQDSSIQQMKKLNQDQKMAFKRCLQMERFCLIQGMPGTGKTQLIQKLIQYFYKMGQTVLVTSFTNQALSNILDRQINQQKIIPVQHIIRQGSRFGIASQFSYLSSQSQSQKNIQQYKQYFSSKKIWFVTISSLYIHHLPKKFDIVIVDQASQCLQASCLQALLKADKFILIGDEKQLQPVIKSPKAIQKNMQISLFERLCNKYPNMISVLKKQYRMSPAIMKLTNNLVYDNRLELGDKSMIDRVLKVPEQWQKITPSFLHNIIDPKKSVRFVNYDSALNLFSKQDNIDLKRIKRLLQIRITCCLYKYFRLLGIEKQKILIISAYNSIVHQLVAALKKQQLIQSNNSDVLTIDKSQGTDKQVIIFIFHQGNRQLIQNYRRLNVAITRAKNKFIIVGSSKELNQLATWTGRLAKLLIPDQVNVEKQFLQGVLNQFCKQKQPSQPSFSINNNQQP